MCFRSNISETVKDIRVLFSLQSRPRVVLPTGTNDVSVVVIVPEISKSSTSAFSNADLYERCKHVQVVPNEVRERLNKNKNESDICQLAYAKLFAKTTGTNSPDGHATIKPKWRNFEKSR